MAELAPHLRSSYVGERTHGLVDIGQKHKQLDDPLILMIAMPEFGGDGRFALADGDVMPDIGIVQTNLQPKIRTGDAEDLRVEKKPDEG